MSAASPPSLAPLPPHVHGWRGHVRAAAIFLVLSILVTGLAYPLLVTAIAQEILPGPANGSLLRCPNGTIVGSADIAQNLSSGALGPGLFWARPSLTDYDTTLGAVTPPGPNDPALLALINETIAYLVEQNATGNTSHSVLVIDPITDRVVGSVAVGLDPTGVAVDAANGYIYATDAGSDAVSVINGATDRVVASIPVGTQPQPVAADSANGLVYVGNFGSSNVSAINGSTDRVVASIPVGKNASGVAVDASTGAVYVTNEGSDNVSVIDGATNKVVTSVPVGVNASAVAVDASTGAVYVTNEGSDNVSVIDGATNRVVASVPVGSEPQAVGVDPANGRVYVSNAGSDNVTVVDAATNASVGSIVVGIYPEGLSADPATGELYVANWYWSNASLPSWWVLPSGSSVDPDLTPSAVLVQIPRVNATTHLPIATLTNLVNSYITEPPLPDLGVPFVNVLELDIALLALQGKC